MDALSIHRAAHWCYGYNIPVIPKVLQILIFFLFNTYLPYSTKIGRGTRIGHRGIGVVINSQTVIGENVLIRAHVTIGEKISDGGSPIIESDVEIGDGAKILGKVRVGRGAVIGANAVVLSDVPAGALAVGVPAQIKKR